MRRRTWILASGTALALLGAGFCAWTGILGRAASRDTGGSSRSPRILLVGWDGMDWDLVEPWIEAGDLPNLAALRREGSWGRLRSIEPLLSPVIWTSIATGTRPEKHGITWFMVDTDRPGQRLPVTSGLRLRKAFWNILTERRRSVGVVGWWATYPAESVSGYVVSDFLGYHGFGVTGKTVRTDLGKTHPPTLAAEISPLLGLPRDLAWEDVSRFLQVEEAEYEGAARGEGRFATAINLFRTYLATARGYTRAALALQDRFAPETLAVYYELPDSAAHLFERFASPPLPGTTPDAAERFSTTVRETYREVDRRLGDLLALGDERTVTILVSDHGFKTGPHRPPEGDDVEVGNAHQWHDPYGAILLAGRDVRRDVRIEKASILDVLPTMLRLLDLPVARDLDGGAILEAIDPRFLAEHPARAVDSFETADAPESRPQEAGGAEGFADEAEARLSALGYLGGRSGSAELCLNRADIYLAKGEVEKAAGELREALRLRPDLTTARLSLAEIYARTQRFELARRELERVRASSPENALCLLLLGDVEREIGNLEKSLSLFEEASRVAPDSSAGWIGLGDVLFRLGRYDEAAGQFERVLRSDPSSALAHYNLGTIRQRQGRIEEAEAHLDLALESDPDHVPSLLNLSTLVAARGERKSAILLMERAIEVAPGEADLFHNLGTLFLEEGMLLGAEEHLKRAIELNPDHGFARTNLGIAYARLGDFARAREQFATLTKTEPLNPEAWYSLARMEAVAGHEAEAAAALEKASVLGGPSLRERAKQDALFEKVAGQPSRGENE